MFRGRGASGNPQNRFESTVAVWDDYAEEGPPDHIPTTLIPDATKTIIARNDSPDIGFESSINPYRGCEHGCAYCYARPYHEYLGFSAGLDFETKLLVKYDAAKLLRAELMKRSWKPQVIVMSGVTDCYQPIERKLQITRQCLEVLAEFGNPVAIITKSRLVTRDIDLLAPMALEGKAIVYLSVTTLDAGLASRLEPRASRPADRLEAIRQLTNAGIPVGVSVAPAIPGLTDEEEPSILKAAREAGARYATYVMLRLPYSVAPQFEEWLTTHYPDRAGKVRSRIKAVRHGKLNESTFGERMRGEGEEADLFNKFFKASKRKLGYEEKGEGMNVKGFRRPGEQLGLF